MRIELSETINVKMFLLVLIVKKIQRKYNMVKGKYKLNNVEKGYFFSLYKDILGLKFK